MYAMQVDTATSSTGGQTRHPSPFPFQEAAARIIELFNVATQTEKHTAFINYAHDRATELQMGWATLADLRRQPVGCNVLLWSFLIPRNCKTQLVKLASRFLMFLYVDHLPPEERKRWVLRHADWAGIHESGAAYRTPEEFAAWYFDGQAYKNSKRMCVDLSRRTRAHQAPPQQLAQHSQLPQLPLWPPTQQATEMTWMMVAQQLAFAPFIVPPVPVAPAPVQYIHQSCDEKQQATDCAPFIECQSAPSPAMGFAPEEQRTDTDVDQYIRSPLTPSRGPAFPMTVPSYQVAAAADDFQPSVASPMGANDTPSLEALANEPQYLQDNLDEWMQC